MNRRHSLPAEVYALVEQTPATVLLESSGSGGACSRLFLSPSRILSASQPSELPGLFDQIERAVSAGHFAAGFFTYECAQAFEPKAALRPAEPHQPLAWFGIYPQSYCYDHAAGAFLNGDPPQLTPPPDIHTGSASAPLDIQSPLTASEYADHIHTVHDWIRAGDVYQLNYTFPLRARVAASPAQLYARLRDRQPVEYGAFIHHQPGRHILSFSPELFFRVEHHGTARSITTRPMKGTAHRGRTTAEDLCIADWMRNDPKNRSENVMIVDLLRNDLGRLCTFGSVRTENLFSPERHSTLWQMTSTVTGDLRPGVDFEHIFRALFPCGSVTGAPKIRAMQLLAQLEEEPRGIYTGAIGFFSPGLTIFNVAIRTLEVEGSNARMGVGSGIVIDSDPAAEFRECQLKAEFLTRVEEPFSLIETLFWQDGYPLLELHLDRLEDSARYFDFLCDRSAVKSALLADAAKFCDRMPRKVRLLLHPNSSLHIEEETLPTFTPAAQPRRVLIASERTDPADRFLFHKTTHRPLYTAAFKTAQEAGYDDVLFLNTSGYVTEGAISNVFVEKDGRWFTPPVECGLLPGVYRRHLLTTQPHAQEKILCLQDLRSADAVYLANAVRGLRRVTVDWSSLNPAISPL
jgi:para-aminobenzoate synthetase/4-amino-4-deoxychorismate lyase